MLNKYLLKNKIQFISNHKVIMQDLYNNISE